MSIGLSKEELHQWHGKGVPYEEYLEKSGERSTPWRNLGKQAILNKAQLKLLDGFVRKMNVLVISGVWCGDCAAQGPMLAAIASATSYIELRWLDLEDSMELSDKVKINAGNRVPTVLFMAEDYESVSVLGDRTLTRYRAMAKRQLGDACDIPGIAIEQSEFDATMQEWLNEFERVQLLLRLSVRLRQKHGD